MKKKNILVCGKGKWGKKVIIELQKISNIIRITDSKTEYRNINLSNIDWVFILTPNKTHFKLTNYFLNKKKNVFCEKPLCLSIKQTLFLIKLARKNKCKLYISDIEKYKQKKIKKDKYISVERKKKLLEKIKKFLIG